VEKPSQGDRSCENAVLLNAQQSNVYCCFAIVLRTNVNTAFFQHVQTLQPYINTQPEKMHSEKPAQ
jgi:hypothetical protein